MRRLSLAMLILAFAIPSSGAGASGVGSFITPSSVHWVAGTGSLAGSESAVIQGDPNRPGIYVLRYRFPDGFTIAPHKHTQSENVDVLSGTLLIGIGDRPVLSQMHAMVAGSFFSIPPETPHYARARGVTIIDVRAMGPRSTTPVHPS